MDSSSSAPYSPKLPQRILIVRLSAHGDVMHTLPLIQAIRQQNPQAMIGWLVESSAASLLEGHPGIDQLHISQRKRWLSLTKNPLNWPSIANEIHALIAELKNAQYQVSFDVQGLLKSAIWPWLAKIPQ